MHVQLPKQKSKQIDARQNALNGQPLNNVNRELRSCLTRQLESRVGFNHETNNKSQETRTIKRHITRIQKKPE